MFLSWLSNLRCSAILFFATFVLLFNAAGVHAASDVSRAHDRPLRLAIVNTYGQILSDMYYGESLKKIREAIAPRPLEIRIYGPDTFLDAARSNQFDMSIASYGLTSIMLRQTGGARVLTAVNNRFPNPYAGNGAAIIVRSDRKDINTFEDLPGKSLGVMSITAFAGWQVPMAELTSMGIDVKRAFRDIKVVGEPMTQILDLVYRGEADVGFVVNCLLEDVQALGKYKEEDFKVIGDRGLRSGSSCKHSTRLYPNWSFSIKPQMSPDESKAVVMALLSIPASEDISVHWTLTPDGTGADAVFQQFVAEVLVEFDPRLVDPSHPFGQDAGPADGKAVGFQAHLLHQGDVLFPAVVEIDGGVSVLAVGDLAGSVVDEGVPDGLAPAVGVPAALDLGGRCGGAPQKVLGEFGHGVFSFTVCQGSAAAPRPRLSPRPGCAYLR